MDSLLREATERSPKPELIVSLTPILSLIMMFLNLY